MNTKPTLTDRLRILFKGILDPAGAFLNRTGLTPNAITLLGFPQDFSGPAKAAVARALKFAAGGCTQLIQGSSNDSTR